MCPQLQRSKSKPYRWHKLKKPKLTNISSSSIGAHKHRVACVSFPTAFSLQSSQHICTVAVPSKSFPPASYYIWDFGYSSDTELKTNYTCNEIFFFTPHTANRAGDGYLLADCLVIHMYLFSVSHYLLFPSYRADGVGASHFFFLFHRV